MGIGQRIRDLVRSRASGGRDMGRIKESLDETYRAQAASLQQVRRGVADVTTSRRRVEVRLTQLRRQAEALDAEARAAVERGDDDAARDALRRRVALEDVVEDLAERHESLRSEEQELTRAADRLEGTVEDFRVRKDTLAARHTAASARAEASSAGSGITSSLSRVNQQMSEAERHTRELEARADAADELVAEGLVARPGESTAALEARRFDAELERLERQVRKEGPGGQDQVQA